MKVNNFFVVLRYLIIIFILVLTILPLAWIILTGFKAEVDYLHTPPIWFARDPSFHNYIEMWEDGSLGNQIGGVCKYSTSALNPVRIIHANGNIVNTKIKIIIR
jgi:ABC-type glycerol-3-phosphate transport system permease component